jgi:hypothetical protein
MARPPSDGAELSYFGWGRYSDRFGNRCRFDDSGDLAVNGFESHRKSSVKSVL